MKFELIALFDAITKIGLFVCVTYAACYFNNWWLMFFCLMGCVMGHSFERKPIQTKAGEEE